MTEPTSPVLLQAHDVTIGYDGRDIMNRLSIGIERGRFTALLGPNGCGKSTLLRALAGLLAPRSGTIRLEGQPIAQLSRKQLARRLSFLPQIPRAPDDITVRDLVEQGRYPHRRPLAPWSAADRAACTEALELTHMVALADQPLAALSGGQRQRAWLAMTLAQSADILLLDEPTTYLDMAHQLELLALLRRLVDERGKTVLAVLHDINQAGQFADKLALLSNGSIAGLGRPVDVVTPEIIRTVFHVDGMVLPNPMAPGPLFLPRTALTIIDATGEDATRS
ncbi:iron complex transport system ATP-binding protein [Ancylobacter aquaticus]|uniref:Iron complex transport system ATP-binding protein n=1 Tax=Ancylobacter aquaticus TaxID=100 RepID=A0A4R1HJB6_ANCAQ|nr:ABC transporter ATP-binding protein [Ancylobacter aquaticus]TCK19609.1 iron complex transport system ATP-binding protein [Ancylobacter aquaticus]